MLRLVTCMSTVKALPSRVVSGQTGTSLKPPEQARELGARTNAFNLFAPVRSRQLRRGYSRRLQRQLLMPVRPDIAVL